MTKAEKKFWRDRDRWWDTFHTLCESAERFGLWLQSPLFLNPPTKKMLAKMDPRHVEQLEYLKYRSPKAPKQAMRTK